MIETSTKTFEGPSLADAIQCLRAGTSALGPEGKPLASQVERLAGFLQREPADLPADWSQIRLVLDAEIGNGWRGLELKSAGAWSTLKSRAKSGIENAFPNHRVDPLRRRGRQALSGEWQIFMTELDTARAAGRISKWAVFTMVGLSRFASANRIEPKDMSPQLFQTWIAAAEEAARRAGKLARNGLVRGPGRHAYDAARTWNDLVEAGLAPGAPIVLKGLKTGRTWNAPIEAFHPELRNEIASYAAWLQNGVVEAARNADATGDDPFGGYASGDFAHVRRPAYNAALANAPKLRVDAVRPGTLKTYRHQLRFSVNAVAARRGVPVAAIRSLAEVVNADGVSKALAVHIERQKERGTWDRRRSTLHGLGSWMLSVARSWSRLDENQLTRIKAILKDPLVKTESVGRMAASRREAIKNIHHDWFVRTWVHLPDDLERQCLRPDGSYRLDERSRARMRAAVVLAIGQILPLRLENLATFTIAGRNPTLIRPRTRRGFWSVNVPAVEIKNQNGAYGVLDGRTSRLIAAYVEHVRPADLKQYAKGTTECLFPGAARSDHRRGHLGIDRIGKAVATGMRWAGLGGGLTSHCIRHITATLVLAWNPQLIQTVADLLGDSVETTEKHYVRGNTAAAVKMNLAMINDHLKVSGQALLCFKAGHKPAGKPRRTCHAQ
jgi:integrase